MASFQSTNFNGLLKKPESICRPQQVNPPAQAAERHESIASQQEFFIGECPAMQQVFSRIRRYAQVDAPVLISGETGTGKELAARAIHQRSARAAMPFVAINCAALPPTLIESELFGYEKGAFTGAVARKLGLIERADGGTLFLDEVGDLPHDLQAHMLRFLQEGTITRLGGHQSIRVNTRVISASHVDLEAGIESGDFRDDLYYRLNVLLLRMPSLREREGDVLVLVAYFLRRISQELGVEGVELTPAARATILAHNWPGNVRELIAAIRRAVVMNSGGAINVEDLALRSRLVKRPVNAYLPRARQPGPDEEYAAYMQALGRHRNNITKAAAELGVSRVTFYRKLKRHNAKSSADCEK
ncbi:MAG: sigma-54 dependent transcriptional regulator [Rhodospirillales bacterium]|nr:sigma-54 dependent transcriptional regulator [Rhodospirillales bacterium]MDE2318798.1 sigma-54-dependent Fis family transcriptional regulator [Rhodospirillales bacterium]